MGKNCRYWWLKLAKIGKFGGQKLLKLSILVVKIVIIGGQTGSKLSILVVKNGQIVNIRGQK